MPQLPTYMLKQFNRLPTTTTFIVRYDTLLPKTSHGFNRSVLETLYEICMSLKTLYQDSSFLEFYFYPFSVFKLLFLNFLPL